MTEPKVYRPPDLPGPPDFSTRPGAAGAARKPWHLPLEGETEPARQLRLSHTCWFCGHFEEDMAELDEHEAGHQPSSD